jgi:Cof subfamily protein (haloacid dehalogenase superfamily)
MKKLEDARGKIRLVAFDLDGTVLNSKKEISPRTKEAMRRAAAQGIRLVPATGRMLNEIPKTVYPGIPYASYAITANGTRIYRLPEKELVFFREFPAWVTRKIIEECRRYRAILFVGHGADGILDDRGAAWEDPQVKEILMRIERDCSFGFADTYEEFALWQYPPCKFTLIFADPDERERAAQSFSRQLECNVTSSDPLNLELMPKGASKGSALAFLMDREGIKAHQVMAVGDSDNDHEMLLTAGFSVAMGNAAPALKKAVDFVTASCDEDGMAMALEGIL